MACEVITLRTDGSIGSEMHGFSGKTCLKAAADIAAELARLGVITELDGIQMKDDAQLETAVQQTALKIETR
ncbi:MAG: hypothetical protein WCX69_01805 [Candidatus Paceibacterota bacterium]